MVIKIEPEFDFDPNADPDTEPRQKTTSKADGSVPKWVAHFVMTEPDGFGGSEIVQVKFAADKVPAFEPASAPVFHRLWANAWVMGNKKGTSILGEGLSFKTRTPAIQNPHPSKARTQERTESGCRCGLIEACKSALAEQPTLHGYCSVRGLNHSGA